VVRANTGGAVAPFVDVGGSVHAAGRRGRQEVMACMIFNCDVGAAVGGTVGGCVGVPKELRQHRDGLYRLSQQALPAAFVPVLQHCSHGNSALKQRISAAHVEVGGNVPPPRLGSLKVTHCVGTGVGNGDEGKKLGTGVGDRVGVGVGGNDGLCVGEGDGNSDGVCDGVCDGFSVGVRDGVCVGWFVGCGVVGL